MQGNRCRLSRASALAAKLAVNNMEVAETATRLLASEARHTCRYSVLFHRSSNKWPGWDLASGFAFFLLSCCVTSCGRGTTRTSTSLLLFSLFLLPIFLFSFLAFSATDSFPCLDCWAPFNGLDCGPAACDWAFFGLIRHVAPWPSAWQAAVNCLGASLIEMPTGKSLELVLSFRPGCLFDQIVPATLLSTFFADPKFYRRSEAFIKVLTEETFWCGIFSFKLPENWLEVLEISSLILDFFLLVLGVPSNLAPDVV